MREKRKVYYVKLQFLLIERIKLLIYVIIEMKIFIMIIKIVINYKYRKIYYFNLIDFLLNGFGKIKIKELEKCFF